MNLGNLGGEKCCNSAIGYQRGGRGSGRDFPLFAEKILTMSATCGNLCLALRIQWWARYTMAPALILLTI